MAWGGGRVSGEMLLLSRSFLENISETISIWCGEESLHIVSYYRQTVIAQSLLFSVLYFSICDAMQAITKWNELTAVYSGM